MSNGIKRVFVADDDTAILEVVQLILEDEGYAVQTAADGEIIYSMKDNFPDIILLDIWMSGRDGRDICRHIKSHKSTRQIPVILISANRNTKKISQEVGANGFLTKPFEMNDLIEIVNKHTNNK